MGGHRISPRFCPDLSVSQSACRYRGADLEAGLKKAEEVMEILEAYDLAGSLRGAAELAGCDHKTVAHWVAQRDLGLVPKLERKRPAMELEYQRKVDELVARSHGRFGGMSRTASWSRSGTSGRRGRRGGGSLR